MKPEMHTHWPEKDGDLLHRDVTRADLVALGCVTPRPRLRAAIESGATIFDHPDAPWKRAAKGQN